MESTRYFSRGKILVSGEYAVLYGARALALPTRWGQFLQVDETQDIGCIRVRSMFNGQCWFQGSYSLPGLQLADASDPKPADFLRSVLAAADSLRPGFLFAEKGYELLLTLEFDTRWGLGSSSSLISNIAWWMDIDPYQLLWKVSNGSGYDIACARALQPLIYHLNDGKPSSEDAGFNPVFSDRLYFVYLGVKQDSQQSVKEFREKATPSRDLINEISDISLAMSRATSLEQFSELMTSHEERLSVFLKVQPVKKARFPGFGSAMKSLGAWGGDMIMVTWDREEEELRHYFEAHGLKLIFRYEDLIQKTSSF